MRRHHNTGSRMKHSSAFLSLASARMGSESALNGDRRRWKTPKHPWGPLLSGDGGWRGEVAVGTEAEGGSQVIHILARGIAPDIGCGPPKTQPLVTFFWPE
jgi:hypothetical protein